MNLKPDDRAVIQTALNLLNLKQAALAKEIDFAASALSDALRPDGKRALPDAKLADLLEILLKESAKAMKDSGSSSRAMLRACADELKKIQSANFGLGLDSIRPGEIVPPGIRNEFQHVAGVGLAERVLNQGGWFHYFAGPKMGVSTVFANVIAYAEVEKCEIIKVAAPPSSEIETENVANSLIRLFHDQIVPEHARVTALDGEFDGDTVRRFFSNMTNWVTTSESSRRRVVVIDGLDEWILAAAGHSRTQVASFAKTFGKILGRIKNEMPRSISMISCASPIAASSLADIGSNVSELFLDCNYSDFHPITSDDASHIFSSCGLDPSVFAQNFREFCCGSIFVTHLCAYLTKRGIEPAQIKEFVTASYEGRLFDIGFAEQQLVARSLLGQARAISRSWDLHELTALTGSRSIISPSAVFRKILAPDDGGLPELTPEDFECRPFLWAKRCALVDRQGRVGAMRSVLADIVGKLEVES
jgi:hypothetical protein